jgi:hypothetical protein
MKVSAAIEQRKFWTDDLRKAGIHLGLPYPVRLIYFFKV